MSTLEMHGDLSDEDRRAVLALPFTERTLEPASYLVREGETPKVCAMLQTGYAYRQKLTSSGNRQIVSLHVPGDALDFQMLFLDVADHNVQALTRIDLITVPRAALHTLLAERGAIARAVTVNILIENSISREWQLNIGRRDARTRLAHFLCEFATRLDARGLGKPDGYELPMSQEQLGDVLGLTSVHVNRTLKVLEAEGVVRRKGRWITFANRAQVERIADFSALYLHLAKPRVGSDKVS